MSSFISLNWSSCRRVPAGRLSAKRVQDAADPERYLGTRTYPKPRACIAQAPRGSESGRRDVRTKCGEG